MPRITNDEEVKYKEGKIKGVIDKVTAVLTGKKSEIFTKIAQEYKRIDDEIDRLQKERDSLNDKVKEKMSAMFDANDEIYTRIIESVSLVANLSKRTPDHTKTIETFDPEGMLEELAETMPELTEQLTYLREKYTTVKEVTVKAKSPALRVKIKEAEGNDLHATIQEYSDLVATKILSNLYAYDMKIKNIS